MKNKLHILIIFFATALSIAPSTAPASAANINLGLDLIRMVISDIAITHHKKDPVAAAQLHAIAAGTGLVRSLVEIRQRQKIGLETSIGELFLLSSSIGTSIIDLIIHINNIKKSATYTEVSRNQAIGIGSTQLLQLVTSYLSDAEELPEFKKAMLNLHLILEALEKIALSGSYETSLINKHVLMRLLACGSAVYSGNAAAALAN